MALASHLSPVAKSLPEEALARRGGDSGWTDVGRLTRYSYVRGAAPLTALQTTRSQ